MNRRLAHAGLWGAGAVALLLLGAAAARAEPAWVGGEVHLNLRAGPGTQYRILDKLETGDRVKILERGTSWTRVARPGGQEGWIPGGYLESQPPPKVRVAELEAQVETQRRKLESLTEEAQRLRQENEHLTARDEERESALRALTEENADLKAGERWPYLIAGASILASGMLVGAVLYASSTRRRQARIRF